RQSAGGPGDYPDYQPLDEPPPTLGIGWCVSRIEGATSDPTAWAVPCKQHHRGEVFEIIPITGNSYPGDDSLKGTLRNCSARLEAYAKMSKVQNMTVFVEYPTRDRWETGDHMVYCIVGSQTVTTTGSVSKSSS